MRQALRFLSRSRACSGSRKPAKPLRLLTQELAASSKNAPEAAVSTRVSDATCGSRDRVGV